MIKSQIYIIHEKIKSNFKIGSTCNFSNRIGGYITCVDNFDDSTHYIELYNIIQSKYSCYQLDWIIQQLSIKYSYPFVKYIGTGGKEFYQLDDFNKLAIFFDKLGIEYTREQIDINQFRKSNNPSQIDYANSLIKDNENLNSYSVELDEFDLIIKILGINTHFKLKQYQNEIRDLFNSTNSRLKDLIISPTGTGKTVIFTVILSDYIIKNKKNIMILTKKKDILTQLPLRIENYIKAFIISDIIKSFNYDIIDCVGDCSTEKLNKLTKPNFNQIYIVNWDKLTSSSKTDFKKINWNKFGLIIVDESHWIGANGIYDVMLWIKDKTKVNYLGFSATPVRCCLTNQNRMLDIFGNKQDYSILYEYSYYQALTNKDICPIKYQVITISLDDLESETNSDNSDSEDDTSNTKNITQSKVLSEKSFGKVWTQINNQIILKTNFKKGIFWFKSRKDLLKYYIFIKSYVKEFNFIPTFSTKPKENKTISKLIKKVGLTDYDLNNSINDFLSIKSNCILLSVFRFTEGSDDDLLEFGIKMYWSNCLSDPLNESQKMGRFSRWINNDPHGLKKFAYYASLEISDNTVEIRNSLINRFKSWISFVRSFSSNSANKEIKPKEQVEKEIREIIDLYVDIDTIQMFQIDIQADIINSYTSRTNDITKIKNALKIENTKRNGEDKINTKSKYDAWAIQYGFPISDELIESGFNDFTKLFGLDTGDYLTWIELKKLCKEYQNKYSNLRPIEIYRIMREDKKNIPDEPEEIYKNKFTCLNDLFL